MSAPSNETTYKALSLISGIVGGALAGTLFNRFWSAISEGDDGVPRATALDRGLSDVLLAGLLQGALAGLVKAALGRITAQGYRRFTGNEPVDNS